MLETATNRTFEFGPFRLDMSRRLLMRGAEAVPLTHKAFEMLALLVENSGRVVEKDELLKEIWPDTFVEEGSLSRNISVLRKTLGEGPSDHHYIQTIPKQGYRFVASVREVSGDEFPLTVLEDQDSDSFSPTPLALPAARIRPSRTAIYLAVFLTVVVLAAISLALYTIFFRRDAVSFPQMTVTRFTNTGKSIDAAISPDGKYVVYVMSDSGLQSLWVKQVAAASHVQIVSPANVSFQGLAFSMDGNYVYYNVWDKEHVGEIYRIPVLGGNAVRVVKDVMPGVAISPDDQKIAFVRSVARTDAQFLMTANADGTDERQVASRDSSNKGWFWQPAWSPDGKTLACAIGEGGEHSALTFRVVTVPVSGGQEKTVSENRWVNIGGLEWTRDGRDIIMTASEQLRTPMQLWLLSYPDGSAKRISNDVTGYYGISLTADSQTLVTSQGDVVSNVWVAPGKDPARSQKITSGRYEGLALSWTPDNRIAYVSQESGNDDIWIMDSDGGNRKQLTTDPNVDVYPSMTADSKYIVFLSLRGGIPRIWRMSPDGSDQKQLFDGDGEFYVESSPTGQWLIYLSVGHRGIWKRDIDGGEAVNFSDNFTFLPAISPDGTRVAFSYWDDTAKPEGLKQGVMNIEGEKHLQSFEIPKTAIGQGSEVLLHWSPDGRAITYIDNRVGVSNIWSMPLAGGQPTRLTDFKDGQIFWFDWSRDGRLAVARGSLTQDIVLISNFR